MSAHFVPAEVVDKIFDGWCADLIEHHGERTVASVLSSPAIQSMFSGDVGQSVDERIADHCGCGGECCQTLGYLLSVIQMIAADPDNCGRDEAALACKLLDEAAK